MTTKTKQKPTKQVEQKPAEPAFTKKKLVASQTYGKYKDILNVLLNDNKLYTRAEVEQIIKNAYSGKYQID